MPAASCQGNEDSALSLRFSSLVEYAQVCCLSSNDCPSLFCCPPFSQQSQALPPFVQLQFLFSLQLSIHVSLLLYTTVLKEGGGDETLKITDLCVCVCVCVLHTHVPMCVYVCWVVDGRASIFNVSDPNMYNTATEDLLFLIIEPITL